MKMQVVRKLRIGHTQLHFNDLLQGSGSIDMHFLPVREQAKRIDQANESEIMITMKVRNKDVRYLPSTHLVFDHLDLGAFTTIYKVIITIMRYHLACRVTVKSRYCGVVA